MTGLVGRVLTHAVARLPYDSAPPSPSSGSLAFQHFLFANCNGCDFFSLQRAVFGKPKRGRSIVDDRAVTIFFPPLRTPWQVTISNTDDDDNNGRQPSRQHSCVRLQEKWHHGLAHGSASSRLYSWLHRSSCTFFGGEIMMRNKAKMRTLIAAQGRCYPTLERGRS